MLSRVLRRRANWTSWISVAAPVLPDRGFVRWLEVVQPDLYATIEVGSHRIIAKVPDGELLEVGQPAYLHFNSGKLHLFDPTTGARLNPAPEEAPPALSRKREALA